MLTDVTKTFENGVLKIGFPVRIGKDNAAEISSYVLADLPQDITGIEVDAGNLTYICSDGLDILLDLKKRCRNLSLAHVSAGLYEVLSSYGFTNFIEIEKKYRHVDVEGLTLLGAGGHGKVYKLNEDMIIKVYKDNSSLEIIEKERIYAKNAFVSGIASPIAFDVVETDEGYGLILEMAGATTLSKYIYEHPEEIDELTDRFTDLMILLNSTPADKSLYGSFREVYRNNLINAGKKLPEKGRKNALAAIDAIPEGNTMIHGDFHPNNVMINSKGELMLIDMADISYGNGFFDIAGSYLVMKYQAKRRPENFINTYKISPQQSMYMWDRMIKRYYGIKTEEELCKYLKICQTLSDIRLCGVLGMKSSKHTVALETALMIMARIKLRKSWEWVKMFTEAKEEGLFERD